jgi:glyoxylase-like metal-dependent hydrolase (beta-lactamase superfamily II)
MWNLHDLQGGKWYGFDAMQLPGIEPEAWLVPMTGHTSGHCGVAIRSGPGWIFLCGDAVPVNLGTGVLLRLAYRPVSGPHFPRLRALAATHPEVRLIAGHMWQEFYKAGSGN